ncbi:uncharacterized protein B0H64DRAFT_21126 [Chaetomium fimeti]|uniref:Uncharacterized protein n=1 Tax=Chaetomium fimeti TaxID=1854472 RepID=A0AAE0HQ66_9PEZI|nr:hypothetical protein B0H64DRAFT_21126 [Chaetomium fimeti]
MMPSKLSHWSASASLALSSAQSDVIAVWSKSSSFGRRHRQGISFVPSPQHLRFLAAEAAHSPIAMVGDSLSTPEPQAQSRSVHVIIRRPWAPGAGCMHLYVCTQYMQVNCTLPITCMDLVNESVRFIRSCRRCDHSPTTVEARPRPAASPSTSLPLPLNDVAVDFLTPGGPLDPPCASGP